MREGAVDHDAHRLGWACRMENVDCEAAKRTLCVDASQKATLQGFEALVKCCLGSRCPIYFRFYPLSSIWRRLCSAGGRAWTFALEFAPMFHGGGKSHL